MCTKHKKTINFGLRKKFLVSILTLVSVNVEDKGVASQSTLNSSSVSPSDNPVLLDATTGYTLNWNVDSSTQTIALNISTHQTNGYIAFGLSPTGFVVGADIVIFGVGIDGNPYISDMYGMNNNTIIRDETQNWNLTGFTSTAGGFSTSISRQLETCDSQDVSITNDLVYIVWGYGSNSTSPVQFTPLGSMPIYLLDQNPPRNLVTDGSTQKFRISQQHQIPARHTSYWCSIRKGPSLSSKRHIIAAEPYFDNELSKNHTHHQLVYQCITPPGIDPAILFEPFLRHPGEECYLNANSALPTAFCRKLIYSWGIGGSGVTYPEDVGFPIGETRNEYFMIESHYDNPEIRSDLVVETGVDLEYSLQLRSNDASILINGNGVYGMFAVPPKTDNFNIIGQCSPDCTKEMFPITGVEVFAIIMHAHSSARKIRVRHFRGDVELPWVINDDNYNYNFQSTRMLSTPVTLNPGDHLVTQCTYDTTTRDGSVVSGFGTVDEMCMSFIYVKKNLPYLFCTSEYPSEKLMSRFRIQNMTWDVNRHERLVTAATQPSLVGQGFSEVVTNSANWTFKQVVDLERDQMYGVHAAGCPNLNSLSLLAYQVVLARILGTNLTNSEQPGLAGIRPNLNTLSTPLASTIVSFPASVPPYYPPSSCPRTPTVRSEIANTDMENTPIKNNPLPSEESKKYKSWYTSTAHVHPHSFSNEFVGLPKFQKSNPNIPVSFINVAYA